jgi:predicted ATPase/DNA-binding CsgD family transcriptional regulator
MLSDLPTPANPIVGRDIDRVAVAELLARGRLITLTGPGGVGKTRLALQVGIDLLDLFPAGVAWVPLAHIRDSRAVMPALAQALGLHEGDHTALEALIEHLRTGDRLLLVDNFEQVLGASPDLAALLSGTLRLKLLVTSRAALQLSGEQEYPLPPLALPPEEEPPAQSYAAVELFVQRARAIRPDFALNAENMAAVATICRRLDGLPLAIELAAARIRLLSPQALLARLDQRLALLTGGARDLPARHQTLRGAIEWSYELLDIAERRLFRRLSVFVGGWTLEAAEAVCDDAPGQGATPAPTQILDGLDSLLAKSLIRQSEAADEPRFGMLETIREYALERLAEHGELAALRQRHAAFCVALAERAEPQLTGQDQLAWFTRLAREQGNLRAALEWLLDGKESLGQAAPLDDGLRLVGVLWRFWWMRGQLREGRAWLDRAIERSAADLPIAELRTQTIDPDRREQLRAELRLRAKLLHGAGALARGQADFTAAAAFQETALALYQELGDRAGIATALNGLGNIAYDQWNFALARTRFEESLALHQAIGNSWFCGLLLNNLSDLCYFEGDYAGARALNEESLALMRRLNSPRGIGYALGGLGEAAHQQGELALAQAQLEESLAFFRRIDDQRGIARALQGLGLVALSRADQPAARAQLEASLALRREIGSAPDINHTLNSLGDLARAAGDLAQARERYAESLASLRQLRPTLTVAGSLAGLAGLAVALGHAERAAELLAAADAVRAALGLPLAPLERPQHDRDLAAVRGKLAASRFAAATERGRIMPLEEAVALALQPLEPAAPPAAAMVHPAQSTTPEELTAREAEVLRLVAAGLSNQEIAERLTVSVYTVQAHLRSIYGKLGVSSRSAATRYAWEHQLVLDAPSPLPPQ